MKKLMLAMAVAGSIGLAQATLTDPVTFEDLTVGDLLNIMPTGGQSDFEWASTATNAAGDVEGATIRQNEEDPQNDTKYLELDGLDQTLQRYAQAQGTPYGISEYGTYIDTRVKFTVSEDDDPVTTTGDKLCIWVGINPETGTTNLMVRAGYVNNDEGNTVASNYVTNLKFDETTKIGDWHNLKVVAFPFIDSDDLGALGDGYVVLVDDTEVAIDGGNSICEEFFNESSLNSAPATFFEKKQLFPSLIGNDTGAGSITSIGFQGSGLIDDLGFGDNPEPPTAYMLTINITDDATNTVVAATVDGNSVASGDLIADGKSVVVVVTPNAGWEYADKPAGWTDGAVEGTITQTFTVSGADLPITIPAPTAVQSEGWDVNPTEIPDNTPAATKYPALAGSALATADAKKLTIWATENNIEFGDVKDDTTGTYVEAYLLNCAPEDVEDEKDEFVLNISIDENGDPVVTKPDGKEYNGTLQLKGKVDLEDIEWTDLEEPSKTYKFYMYELSL